MNELLKTEERRYLYVNTPWKVLDNLRQRRFASHRGKMQHRTWVWAMAHLHGHSAHEIYRLFYRSMRGRRFLASRVRVE